MIILNKFIDSNKAPFTKNFLLRMNVPQYLTYKKKQHNIDQDVVISVFEFFENYKLSFKRMYFLETQATKTVRGKHAHINQDQVFILQEGSASIFLTNKVGKIEQFEIKKIPLLVPAGFWIELHMSVYTKVLCLATQPYSQLKTISNKELFLKQVID